MTLSSAARHVAAAVVIVATLLVAAVPPASAQSNRLTIRVCDCSARDQPVRMTAVDEARTIMADAGVTAEWHDCTRSREACGPESGDLVIRVIRETGSGALEWRRALGYSVVDPVADTGTLATI